jgi:hypothetical protein
MTKAALNQEFDCHYDIEKREHRTLTYVRLNEVPGQF